MSVPGRPARTTTRREVAATLSVVVLLTGALAIVMPVPRGESPWRSFDLVLVPDDVPLARVRTRLAATGRDVLDAESARVVVEEFTGAAPRTLASVSERFDADDPRLDPFLQAAPRLFRAGTGDSSYHVIYLARGGAGPISPLGLGTALEGVPHRLVAGSTPIPLIVTAGALLAMIAVLASMRERRLPVLAAMPAVLALAFGWGAVGLVRAVVPALGWAVWQDARVKPEREYLVYGRPPREHERVTASDVMLVLSALAATLTFAIPDRGAGATWREVLGQLLFCAVLATISRAAFVVHRRRVHDSEHPFFQPRPILPRARRVPAGAIPARSVLVVAAVLLLTLVAVLVSDRLFAAPAAETIVPVPEYAELAPDDALATGPVASDPESGASILTRASAISPQRRPLSTAGFVAHRWYQDTLVWGGQYRVPAPGEAAAIYRYERSADGLTARLEPQVVADERWLATLSDAGRTSLYRVFLEEGGVFSVVAQPFAVAGPAPGLLMRLALIVLSVPLLLASIERLPKVGAVGTVQAARRVRQQA